ncbi:hypothetical protein JI59_16425 [Novosphingobium pentaromativorans US6-1]|nr:hypothetical protein JI59_16425 [Novosphingobium pentaromativorans US6-1]
MTVPGQPLPTAAPIGSHPPACRFANTTRGAGAVAGNRRRSRVTTEPNMLHLTYDEAEVVAAYLLRVWPGATGLATAPQSERAADVVQLVLRKSREVIADRDAAQANGRMHVPENELPY